MNFHAKNSVSKAQFWSPTAIQLHIFSQLDKPHQSAFANSHLGYTANYLRRRTANHSCRTILFQVFRHVCSYNVLGKLKAHVVSQAWVHGLYGIGGTWRSCWTKKIGLSLKSKPRIDSVIDRDILFKKNASEASQVHYDQNDHTEAKTHFCSRNSLDFEITEILIL